MLRRLILILFVFMCVDVESQQWLVEYPSDESEMVSFVGGDVSGKYNYSVGFRYNKGTGVYNPIALCFDREGIYRDKSYHETIDKGCFCYALGLGDGNAFVVARCGADVENDVYENLWFAIINPELEVIREKYIEIDNEYFSYGSTMHALMDDKGEIVVVTQVADRKQVDSHYGYSYDYAFYKVSKDCDLLRCSYLKNISDYAEISDFTLVPDTNLYAVFGNGMNGNNVETVFYINDGLDYVSFDFIDDFGSYPDLLYPKFMCVDHWLDEDEFLMSAQSSRTNGMNEWYPLVLKMDVDMNVIDMLSFERLDTTCYVSQFRSMAYVDSNTIYVSTFEYIDVTKVGKSNKATVFVINEDLELLGIKDFEMRHYFNILHIQPTFDKGCIVQGYIDDGKRKQSIICKLARSDFENPLNLMEKDIPNVNVYPNPVSSSMNIGIDNVEEKCVNVRISDILGRRYLDEEVELKTGVVKIDVSSLTKGLYLCYIEYDKGRCIKRVFIKE